MSTQISRRKFLKTFLATGGTSVAGSLLAACGSAPAATNPTSAATGGGVTTTTAPAALPFDVAAEAMNPLNIQPAEVDGVFFAGGFGDEYIKYAANLMEQLHPGVTVKTQSIQKVTEQLQPRFVAGNPPDIINNSGANLIPITDLVREEQLMDLTPLLEAPALDTPGKKFKDTLFPGSQDSAIFEGIPYAINIAYTISGIWYSRTAFDQAGYTYPQTWDEMLTLSEQIKQEGGASPWTYQGKYPYYIWGIIWNMLVYYAGGVDTLIKLDNLEPDAYADPAVRRATEDLYQLYDKGYILPGTAGLTHTEAQTEWLKGSAIFIPCGNWLENEMKELTPAGFNMAVGNVPGYADGKGQLNAVNAIGGESYIVPVKGKNPQHGMEFLRTLLSKESARFFAENVRAIMPVIGGAEGANLSEGMKSAIQLVEASQGVNVLMNFPNWYSQLNRELETRTGELMSGVITPDEFLTAMQKASDAVAQDPEIKKFTREQ
ncbi:MAG: N-acetylglucosamine/diacetylchitobiose ABC transporter substrate-binding protein [Chloroflexales bacterium]|nr:N-acetylglucosamine/diacetylchitobiose ABC transporter substrate-binding protein [Chloroflexales bacterium]